MIKKNKLLVGVTLVLLLAGTSAYFYIQNKGLKTQLQHMNLEIAQEAESIVAFQKNGQSDLMSHLFNKIDAELKDNPKRELSNEAIQQITTICFGFKPYLRVETNSVSAKMLSPERGQLLLILAAMNIDTASWHSIKLKTSFANADLRGANLSGIDLSEVDLNYADLQDANLMNTNLHDANLSFTHLWGANLSGANLNRADLTRADLRWADLNGTNLEHADLKEANMVSAQLRKANLSGAILQWADCRESFLIEADLTCADMYRTRLDSAQLTGANIMDANLVLAHLVKTNLVDVNFTNANLTDLYVIEPNWLELLNEWHVSGVDEILSAYKIIDVSAKNEILYQVKKL